MADVDLSVGELLVLKSIACKYFVGEIFDIVDVLKPALQSLPGKMDVYPPIAESLSQKGLFEKHGDMTYSLTLFGENCWKAIFRDTWRKSREGAGRGGTRKRA